MAANIIFTVGVDDSGLGQDGTAVDVDYVDALILAIEAAVDVEVAAVVPAVNQRVCDGRITLTTAVPVTTADVLAATTIRFAPYLGNQVALYSGSAWALYTLTERSLAVPATTDTNYDLFLYNNAGTLTLEALAWTNATTRATALVAQDGIWVKSGATTRRYLGSFRTTGVSGQTEDSYVKRFVWNLAHRMPRPMRRLETTDTWTYQTAILRQANASALNQLAILVGLVEDPIEVDVQAISYNAGLAGRAVTIGEDSTTVGATGVIGPTINNVNAMDQARARLVTFPALGYHYYAWLEYSDASGTSTWYGDNGSAYLQSGMTANWRA